jgi:hypothetical protein
MMREREGIAAHVLERLGVDLAAVRERAANVLDSPNYRRRNEAAQRQSRISTRRLNLVSMLFLIGLVTVVLAVAIWVRRN